MHISYPIEILLSSKEVKCFEKMFFLSWNV